MDSGGCTYALVHTLIGIHVWYIRITSKEKKLTASEWENEGALGRVAERVVREEGVNRCNSISNGNTFKTKN